MSRFFSFDSETFEFHSTPALARACAERALGEDSEEAARDGWPEEVSQICWGQVLERVTLTRSVGASEARTENDERALRALHYHDEYAEYELRPVPEVPLFHERAPDTERFLAHLELSKGRYGFMAAQCRDSAAIHQLLRRAKTPIHKIRVMRPNYGLPVGEWEPDIMGRLQRFFSMEASNGPALLLDATGDGMAAQPRHLTHQIWSQVLAHLDRGAFSQVMRQNMCNPVICATHPEFYPRLREWAPNLWDTRIGGFSEFTDPHKLDRAELEAFLAELARAGLDDLTTAELTSLNQIRQGVAARAERSRS